MAWNWIGGSGNLEDPNHWEQPDPNNPTVPGAGDDVSIDGGGGIVLTGTIAVANATLDGVIDLQGSLKADAAQLNGNLTISNGGTLTDNSLTIDAGATAIVDGSGSALNDNGNGSLVIEGSLTVQNSASGTSGWTDIGQSAGSDGVFTLNQATWTANTLDVGDAGQGQLSVQSSSNLDVTNGFDIGASAGGTGQATIDDSKVQLDSGVLFVGGAGNGQLLVQSGATLTASQVSIGNDQGSVGEVTVDGSGTAFNNQGSIVVVGYQGQGSLTVQNSASGSSGWTDVAQLDGSSGVFTLNQATWTADSLGVGDAGDGKLYVQSGSNLNVTTGLNIGSSAGGTGQATIDDSKVTVDGCFVGGAGKGQLFVQSGSTLDVTAQMSIDGPAGGTGTVTVDGSGTTLDDSSGLLVVGYQGNGTLTVQNSATGSSGWTDVAQLAGSSGVFTLNQAKWTADSLGVGDSGDGQLYVQSGSTLVATNGLTVGNAAGGNGQVTIDGSKVTVGGGTIVGGDGGVGNLTLQNAATLTVTGSAGWFSIGDGVGSHGVVTITGVSPGSRTTLDISGSADDLLVIGNSGHGELDVTNDALVKSQTGLIGNNAGSVGKVVLDHAGWLAYSVVDGGDGQGELDVQDSAALSTQNLGVANNAGGKLNVSGGSQVQAFDLTIGNLAGSNGEVDVNGTGTTLQITGNPSLSSEQIAVGNGGNGILNIGDHATVTTNTINIAVATGSSGNVSVSGGASLTAASWIIVGNVGTGIMNVTGGSTVTIGANTGIGSQAGSSGTVTVDGSSWTSNSFIVGNSGAGNLTVKDAGTVTVSGTGSTFFIGQQANSQGTVDVTGEGSTLDASGTNDLFYVGYSGNGNLTVENGATLKTQRATLGATSGSSGNVAINGATWTAANIIDGASGAGNLTIENAATVTSQAVTIGQSTGSNGQATIDGSTWSASSITDGGSGTGSLTIQDTATVTVANSVNLAQAAGSTGNLTINDANLAVGKNINVGMAGSATALIENGAVVTAGAVEIGGIGGNGSGIMTVTGAGTSLSATNTATNSTELGVGFAGNGTLNITDQAQVTGLRRECWLELAA